MDDPKGKGYREDERSNVEAENCEQVAGRDIHNDNREQRLQFILQMILAAADPSPPPNPDSPHLDDCPHCGRRWVSRLALFCPTCGFSAQYARESVSHTRRFRIELTIVAVPVFLAALLLTPTLDEATSARNVASMLTYTVGNLLALMAGALCVVATWLWWRWWRGGK